jgi:hypothetical protein
MSVRITGIDAVRAQLRAELNSQVAIGESRIIDSLIVDLKEATPVDTGEARDGWHREGNHIVNNVDHIDVLNSGSSEQAPSHFIEQTILKNSDVSPNGIIVTQNPHT